MSNKNYQQYRIKSSKLNHDHSDNNNEYQIQNVNVQKLNNLPVQQSESDSEQILNKIDNILYQKTHQHYLNNQNYQNQYQQQHKNKNKHKNYLNNQNQQQQQHKQKDQQQQDQQQHKHQDLQHNQYQQQQQQDQYQQQQSHNQQDQLKIIQSKQALLNYKITQLHKIIHTLSEANRKLTQKLQQNYLQIQQNNNRKKNDNNENNKTINILNSSTQSNNIHNNIFNDELTLMQGEFGQIQSLISEYKQQLAVAERKWVEIKQEKDQQIQILKKQILVLSDSQQDYINQINNKNQQIQMIKSKNQELLIELQNLQIQLENHSETQNLQMNMNYNIPKIQYNNHFRNANYNPIYRPQDQYNYQDYRFNQKIQKQMEIMIKKLLKQLSLQKKSNHKLNYQIKRLNSQVIESQRKIKIKNDHIYQLEMKIIYLQKNNPSINTTPYMKSPSKRIPNHDGISQFTPQHTKNNSRIGNFNINLIGNGQQNEKGRIINNTISNNTSSSRIKSRQQSRYVEGQSNVNIKKNQNINAVINNWDRKPIIKNYVNVNMNQNKINGNGNGNGNRNQVDYLKRNNQRQGYSNGYMNVNNINNNNNNNNNNSNNINNNNNTIHNNMKNNTNKPQTNKSNQLVVNSSSSNTSRMFSSFSLIQLQQGGSIKVTLKQKIIIICRLIDFYCKKLIINNYQSLMSQNIQISNFHQKHPNLIRIRINKSQQNCINHEQQNQECMLWNMAFIIQNIIKEVQTIDRKDVGIDLNLIQIIEELLLKTRQQKKAYFQQLSKYLQTSVA